MKYADISKLKHINGYMTIEDIPHTEYIVQEHKPKTNYLPSVSENYTRQQRMTDFIKRYNESKYDVIGKDVF